METYQQIKARHQAEVNAFPIGAAFSNSQVADMMRKFGLPNDETGYRQIVSLGAGSYIKRSDIPAWNEMAERHKREMAAFKKQKKELTAAIRYEFANHEYHYGTCQDETICESVGLKWSEVQSNPELLKIYKKANDLFMEDVRLRNTF